MRSDATAGPRETRRPGRHGVAACAVALLVASSAAGSAAPAASDVVVYGGTPAGVTAAVAAARAGARVTLLAEGTSVGGMMSNGISATDLGTAAAVRGLASEFLDRVRTSDDRTLRWRFEPRVAERALRRMLAQARVRVSYRAALSRVTTAGARVSCIVTRAGRSFCGEAFVDASYTGDLIAAARVPHRLGTGDLLSYSEALAARRGWGSVLTVPAERRRAAETAFSANPFVRPAATLPPYREAHARGMPALTYRLCVTDQAGNLEPFRQSPDYPRLLPSFRFLAQAIGPTLERRSNGSIRSDAYQLARIPGGKYDLNAGYASLTNVPAPAGYFDDPGRRRYWDTVLRRYVNDFFYFVQHDQSVPVDVRTELARFGLCKDEFTDNGAWPRQPYVREGRRIVGRHTMTERDIFVDRTKRDAIALASYDVDSKVTQWRLVDGTLYRDVSPHSRAAVYEVPYTALVPAAGSVVNLVAPIGVSASPVAYGSLRMEVQYMALGQAAGIAAALGARTDRALTTLPYAWVQRVLRAEGAIYKALDACRGTPTAYRDSEGYTRDCTRVLPVEQVDVPR